MNGETTVYALITLPVLAALVAVLRSDARQASVALVGFELGLAALFTRMGAGGVGLMLCAALVGVRLVSRAVRRQALVDEIASSAGESATTENGRVDAVGNTGNVGAVGADNESELVDGHEFVRRAPAVVLLAAFFVLVLRALLIARWPLPSSGSAAAAVLPTALSLPHFLVTALVLFCLGMFAAATRRSVAGVEVGIRVMVGAVALTLVAFSCFVVGGEEGGTLAGLLVAIAAVWRVVGRHFLGNSSPLSDRSTSERVGTTLLAMVAGVALLLLAGIQ